MSLKASSLAQRPPSSPMFSCHSSACLSSCKSPVTVVYHRDCSRETEILGWQEEAAARGPLVSLRIGPGPTSVTVLLGLGSGDSSAALVAGSAAASGQA